MSARLVLASIALAAAIGIGGAFAQSGGTSGGGGLASGGLSSPVADADVDNDLTISGGTVNASVIGGVTPAAITGTTVTATGNITFGDAATDTTSILGPISNPGAGTPTGCATAGAVCVSDAAGLEIPGGGYVKDGAVTTTDATVTTVLTIAIPTNTVLIVNPYCSMIKSDGTAGGAYAFNTTARNSAGTGTLVNGGAVAVVHEDAAVSAATMDAAVSGTNIILRATGIAATTITWRCRVVNHVVAP